MLKKTLFLSLFAISTTGIAVAQSQPKNNPAIIEKANPEIKDYQTRIKQEKLLGVYIPKDLNDCFAQLEKLSDQESIDKFKALDESLAAKKLFFGLGRWLATNYAFYEGSRFSNYLRELGVTNPDDMINFVITTWHRHLNGKDLGVKDLVLGYKEKQRKEMEEKHKNATIIKEETKPARKQ